MTPQPPGDPDLARPAVAAPAASPSPPPVPVEAEVEMSGTVTLPKGQTGAVTVWITDGPCWQPGTQAFNSTKALADGKWFLEVFVKQGTQLWTCAAVGDPARPLTVYGQGEQAPLLGKGVGEIIFNHVTIPLAKGRKPVAAPPRAPPPSTARAPRTVPPPTAK